MSDRDKARRVIEELRVQTEIVRENPSEENYKKAKEAIERAGDDSEFWQYFVAIIVVVGMVLGLFVLVAATINMVSNSNLTNKSTSNPVVVNSTQPVSITNQLVMPIDLYVYNKFYQEVPATRQSTLYFYPYQLPTNITFKVVPIKNSNGTSSGDEMSGIFNNVTANSNLVVNNVIGGQFYFFPEITNNTNWSCEISINDGYVNERRPGTMGPHAQNVVTGYFKYYSNSNVTLYCPPGTRSNYRWGSRPGDKVTPINWVQANSGLAVLTLNP